MGRVDIGEILDDYATIIPSGMGEVTVVIDEATGAERITRKVSQHGNANHRKSLGVGAELPDSATVYAGIASGSTSAAFTDSLGNPAILPPNSLQPGWVVYVADATNPDDMVQVLNVTIDATTGGVTGFTTVAPFSQTHAGPAHLYWHPLDHHNTSHIISSSYIPASRINDPKAGPALTHRPSGTSPTVAAIHHADGSTSIGGSGGLSPSGKAYGVHDLALSGGELSHGVERHGFIPFDSYSFESGSQAIDYYPQGYYNQSDPTIPSTIGYKPGQSQYGGNYNDSFYGGPISSTVTGIGWTPTTPDNSTGAADYILSFKITNPYQGGVSVGGVTRYGYEFKRWYDQGPIKDADGSTRAMALSKDMSIAVPVYAYQPTPTSVSLALGSQAKSTRAISAGDVYIYPDYPVGNIGTVANDQWLIDAGTPTQETFTISSIDSANNRLRTSAFIFAHNPNASISLYMGTGGTNRVQSGASADGRISFGETNGPIDVIQVGLWDGATWWRGWWGDPAWAFGGAGPNTAPYPANRSGSPYWIQSVLGEVGVATAGALSFTLQTANSAPLVVGQWIQVGTDLYQVSTALTQGQSTTISISSPLKTTYPANTNVYPNPAPAWLGPLNVPVGQWKSLHTKASQLFPRLRAGSVATIQGAEVAALSYSATPSNPVTISIDAISIGATTHKYRIPAGSATSRVLARSSVGLQHLVPAHNSQAISHNDVYFWVDGNGRLQWTSGTIVLHNGTKYVINGTAEGSTSSSTGVPGFNSGQGTAKGNWILLNLSGSSQKLYDPATGNTVIIPAYSPGTTSPFVQSTGFGVVSDQFDWSGRIGNRQVGATGAPNTLMRIAQIGYNFDSGTGLLPAKASAGHHAKIGADNLANGSITTSKFSPGAITHTVLPGDVAYWDISQTFNAIQTFANGFNLQSAASPGPFSSVGRTVGDILSDFNGEIWEYVNGPTVKWRRLSIDFAKVYIQHYLEAAGIAAINVAPAIISNITWTSGTVTVTTASSHNYTTGMQIAIWGCSPYGYNGSYAITVPTSSTNTFTFALASNPGTISAVWSYPFSAPDCRGPILSAWNEYAIKNALFWYPSWIMSVSSQLYENGSEGTRNANNILLPVHKHEGSGPMWRTYGGVLPNTTGPLFNLLYDGSTNVFDHDLALGNGLRITGKDTTQANLYGGTGFFGDTLSGGTSTSINPGYLNFGDAAVISGQSTSGGITTLTLSHVPLWISNSFALSPAPKIAITVWSSGLTSSETALITAYSPSTGDTGTLTLSGSLSGTYSSSGKVYPTGTHGLFQTAAGATSIRGEPQAAELTVVGGASSANSPYFGGQWSQGKWSPWPGVWKKNGVTVAAPTDGSWNRVDGSGNVIYFQASAMRAGYVVTDTKGIITYIGLAPNYTAAIEVRGIGVSHWRGLAFSCLDYTRKPGDADNYLFGANGAQITMEHYTIAGPRAATARWAAPQNAIRHGGFHADSLGGSPGSFSDTTHSTGATTVGFKSIFRNGQMFQLRRLFAFGVESQSCSVISVSSQDGSGTSEHESQFDLHSGNDCLLYDCFTEVTSAGQFPVRTGLGMHNKIHGCTLWDAAIVNTGEGGYTAGATACTLPASGGFQDPTAIIGKQCYFGLGGTPGNTVNPLEPATVAALNGTDSGQIVSAVAPGVGANNNTTTITVPSTAGFSLGQQVKIGGSIKIGGYSVGGFSRVVSNPVTLTSTDDGTYGQTHKKVTFTGPIPAPLIVGATVTLTGGTSESATVASVVSDVTGSPYAVRVTVTLVGTIANTGHTGISFAVTSAPSSLTVGDTGYMTGSTTAVPEPVTVASIGTTTNPNDTVNMVFPAAVSGHSQLVFAEGGTITSIISSTQFVINSPLRNGHIGDTIYVGPFVPVFQYDPGIAGYVYGYSNGAAQTWSGNNGLRVAHASASLSFSMGVLLPQWSAWHDVDNLGPGTNLTQGQQVIDQNGVPYLGWQSTNRFSYDSGWPGLVAKQEPRSTVFLQDVIHMGVSYAHGVYSDASATTIPGVEGIGNATSVGVLGLNSSTGDAVRGVSTGTGNAVSGDASASTGAGVNGVGNATSAGVLGINNAAGPAVYGFSGSGTGPAGKFAGNAASPSVTISVLGGQPAISTAGGIVIGGVTATTGAFSDVITSTKATGTAPFTVSSTTKVINLNVDSIQGAQFTAVGDLLVGTGSSVGSKLSVGTANQVLVGGSTPTWGLAPLAAISLPTGALMVGASSVGSSLADVATGQVLVSGGVGAAPSYSATPSLTSVTVTAGIQGPYVYPATDSTVAWGVKTHGGAYVVVVDTTNTRLAVGNAAPLDTLDLVGGGIARASHLAVNSNATSAFQFLANDRSTVMGTIDSTHFRFAFGGSAAPSATIEAIGNGSELNALTLTSTQGSANELVTLLFRDSGFTTGSAAIKYKLNAGGTSGELQLWTSNAGTMTENMVLNKLGQLGIGSINSPTAALHLPAGSTTASTSPFKFTSGTKLTTPESGAIEFDGTSLYYTDSTPTRHTIATNDGGTSSTFTWNAQTTAYTLTSSDAGNVVSVNASGAVNITVPSGIFAIGTQILIMQDSVNTVTLVAGSGVTFKAPGVSLSTRTQNSVIGVMKQDSSEKWIVFGDLGAT